MSGKLRVFLIIVMLAFGIGVLLYPDIASWYQSRRHVAFIQEYNENVALNTK